MVAESVNESLVIAGNIDDGIQPLLCQLISEKTQKTMGIQIIPDKTTHVFQQFPMLGEGIAVGAPLASGKSRSKWFNFCLANDRKWPVPVIGAVEFCVL